MQNPERFSALPDYAFARLRALLDPVAPGAEPVNMAIGEPTHAPPRFVADILAREADGWRPYPPNEGSPDLRGAIAAWLERRYGASLDPERQVLPLTGTREGLFMAALALCPERKNGARPAVLLPNPFYQCYAAAALAAGAEPVYVNASAATGFLPDFASLDRETLNRAALIYVCSPANPQGAVADAAYWRALAGLAERHDCRILADECYAELYRDAPPPGALQAGGDPERVIVFHSLSKRSNLAGLRSGFCAGGAGAIGAILKLRAYGGAPMPRPVQAASAAAWTDEAHVEANRALYRRKYALADEIMSGAPGYRAPQAGFFLWQGVRDGEKAAMALWEKAGLRSLPGAYLSRQTPSGDPGQAFLRLALVAPEEKLAPALRAARAVLEEIA